MPTAKYDPKSEVEMPAAQQDAKERMDEDADLVYETHRRWGAVAKHPVWTTSTYPKTMTLFRSKIPSEYLKTYNRLVSAMSNSQQAYLKNTVQEWSDDQFSLLTEKMKDLNIHEFLSGIRILAGEHAYLKAKKYTSDLQLPQIKEKKLAGPEESSQDWKMLQSRIHALPTELFRMVRSWTLHYALLADIEIDLTSRPLSARKCIRDQINIGLLKLLDRDDVQEYKDRIWTENLWIIPSGPITSDMRYPTTHMDIFFSQIPETHCSKISRLKVSFTRQDYFYLDHFQKAKLQGFYDEWVLFMSMSDLQDRNFPFHMLCDIWMSKAALVARILDLRFSSSLSLKKLILDFKDARGPDDVLCGARIAMYLAVRLTLPPLNGNMVVVEAHTPGAAENIRRIIIDEDYRHDVADLRESIQRLWPEM